MHMHGFQVHIYKSWTEHQTRWTNSIWLLLLLLYFFMTSAKIQKPYYRASGTYLEDFVLIISDIFLYLFWHYWIWKKSSSWFRIGSLFAIVAIVALLDCTNGHVPFRSIISIVGRHQLLESCLIVSWYFLFHLPQKWRIEQVLWSLDNQ